MRNREPGPVPGALLRQVKLGSEAIYRILRLEGGCAHVEVVRAPGLEPGHRLRLTLDAVQAMEPFAGRLPEPREPHASAARACTSDSDPGA